MRVLVAEDDPIAQEMIRSFLESEHYEVSVADSGDEAWQQFSTNPTSFVITDREMPGGSGLELCRRIRGQENGSAPM